MGRRCHVVEVLQNPLWRGDLSCRVQTRGPVFALAMAPNFLLESHHRYLRFGPHLNHPLLDFMDLGPLLPVPAVARHFRRRVGRRRQIALH